MFIEKLVTAKSSLDEAFTSGKLNNDCIILNNNGFGWFIENDSLNGKIQTTHWQLERNYRAWMIRFTDTKDCIIVLNNNDASFIPAHAQIGAKTKQPATGKGSSNCSIA